MAERIARTEGARARYDAFMARNGEDEDVVAYKWKLGSRHPAEDICDMYANADLYGLGKGIFPKDKVVPQPAHPHCLCHYAPVYWGEIDEKKRSNNVEENGRAWLAKQPLHIRQAILGVKGEQEWKAGRVGWMEKARNLSDMFGQTESRLKPVLLNSKNAIITSKRFPKIAGKYKYTQNDLDEICKNELGNVRFTVHPKYNGRIVDQGRTDATRLPSGRIVIKDILIGRQAFGSRESLLDSLIHEELEARIWVKSNYSSRFKRLSHGSDVKRHGYINIAIQRFFRLKGWDYGRVGQN